MCSSSATLIFNSVDDEKQFSKTQPILKIELIARPRLADIIGLIIRTGIEIGPQNMIQKTKITYKPALNHKNQGPEGAKQVKLSCMLLHCYMRQVIHMY